VVNRGREWDWMDDIDWDDSVDIRPINSNKWNNLTIED
jgi:hypothetical protein